MIVVGSLRAPPVLIRLDIWWCWCRSGSIYVYIYIGPDCEKGAVIAVNLSDHCGNADVGNTNNFYNKWIIIIFSISLCLIIHTNVRHPLIILKWFQTRLFGIVASNPQILFVRPEWKFQISCKLNLFHNLHSECSKQKSWLGKSFAHI